MYMINSLKNEQIYGRWKEYCKVRDEIVWHSLKFPWLAVISQSSRKNK